MSAYHKGQEVEVWGANMYPWRKAKIVRMPGDADLPGYGVQFPDGTRGVFDAEHIRHPRLLSHGDHFPSDYECCDGSSE